MQIRDLAENISHIFDPLVAFLVLGILSISRSGLSGFSFARILLIFLMFMILTPAALLGWAVVRKKVTNWDVSDRKQRVKVLAIFLLMTLIDLLLVKHFGNAALFNLFAFFAVWYIGFFLITLFWKISGHMAALTLVILLIIRWYGLVWAPLIFLLPLLGWARVTSRSHNLAQVIAGVMYSFIVFEFVKFA